jgi:hypothetical protein
MRMKNKINVTCKQLKVIWFSQYYNLCLKHSFWRTLVEKDNRKTDQKN